MAIQKREITEAERDEIEIILFRKAKHHGDPKRAVELLHKEFGLEILKKARQFAPNPQIAEEWAQNVWMTLLERDGKRIQQFSPKKATAGHVPWFRTVYRRLLIDSYRKFAATETKHDNKSVPVCSAETDENEEVMQLSDTSPLSDPLKALQDQQIGEDIRSALDHKRVSDNQRMAFFLTKIRQLSVKQASRIMGVSESTVKTHVRAAILQLRILLSETYNEIS